MRAVADGARVIGLIDGVFEHMPSIWHKEILYALSAGVTVAGAASMGALRAAECRDFGMIGVGAVFAAYASGAIEDDDAVAQLHGPAELGFVPLSEPLVNIRASLDRFAAEGRLEASEHERLLAVAQAMFFKERSYRHILDQAGLDAARRHALAQMLKTQGVHLKQQDAVQLLDLIEAGALPPAVAARQWILADTRSLRTLLRDASDDECNHLEK